MRGYSALAAGVLTLPAAVPALIGGPLSGYLVGTRGPRGVLVGGMLVLGAGVGSLALLAEDAAIGWLLAAYLVVGVGYAVLSAPVSTVAVASMPRDQAGVAAGLASSARNVGIVFGIAVLGAIVNGRVPGDADAGERRVRCGALGVPARCTSMRSTSRTSWRPSSRSSAPSWRR